MNPIFAVLVLALAVYVKAAPTGEEFITIYADDAAELFRSKREPDALGLKTHHLHHHIHQQGSGGEYYSKPQSCSKCGGGGGGGGGGPVATFAQSSAGTISGGGQGGHQGGGGQSVSQSAAYNFGPFSASFSSSQSNGGLYGGFF